MKKSVCLETERLYERKAQQKEILNEYIRMRDRERLTEIFKNPPRFFKI